MDKSTFVSCIGLLQQLFGVTKDDSVLRFMWERFSEYDDELFKKVTQKIIDTFKPTSTEPFPSVSRFIDLLEGDENGVAIIAVGTVKQAASNVGPYRSISFGDRALHETINHFGGWPEVSSWHEQEWSFNEKRFIDTYKAYRKYSTGPSKLIGLSEEHYKLHGGNYHPQILEKTKQLIGILEFKWYGYKPLLEDKTTESINGFIEALGDKFSM